LPFRSSSRTRKTRTPTPTPWEQTNVLVEGELGFVVGDEQVTLEQYDALTVPPGVEHTSRAISDEEAKMLVIWPLPRGPRGWNGVSD